MPESNCLERHHNAFLSRAWCYVQRCNGFLNPSKPMSRQIWNEKISSAALCLINYASVWKRQTKTTAFRSHVSIYGIRNIDKILFIYITYEMPWFIVIGVIKNSYRLKAVTFTSFHSWWPAFLISNSFLFYLHDANLSLQIMNLLKIRMSAYLSAAIYLLRRRMTRNPQ